MAETERPSCRQALCGPQVSTWEGSCPSARKAKSAQVNLDLLWIWTKRGVKRAFKKKSIGSSSANLFGLHSQKLSEMCCETPGITLELKKGKIVREKCVPGATAMAAGVEMGFWNFLATSLQAIGLERTSAIRGAFIIQVNRRLLTGKACLQSGGCSQLRNTCLSLTPRSTDAGQRLIRHVAKCTYIRSVVAGGMFSRKGTSGLKRSDYNKLTLFTKNEQAKPTHTPKKLLGRTGMWR